MEKINEDNMTFVPMVDKTAIDAYLDDWITREQLLDIFLREPERLNEKDRESLLEDHSTLERIVHEYGVARILSVQ